MTPTAAATLCAQALSRESGRTALVSRVAPHRTVSAASAAGQWCVRADLDFETNVRSEVWSIHMGRALGVDPVEVERRVQEMLAENRARLDGTARPSTGG
nr:hypothetical protein [Streptomyces antibioticus]